MSGSSGRARYLHRLLAEQAGVTLGFYARANGDEWQRNNCYSVPRQILRTCARQLQGLPVLFVGVRCSVEVAMERRRATWGGVGYNQGGTVLDPPGQWHEAVHKPGICDLEVDTSVLRPEECADLIASRLTDGPPPFAFRRLAEPPVA